MSNHGFRRFLFVIMLTSMIVICGACGALMLLNLRPGPELTFPFSLRFTPVAGTPALNDERITIPTVPPASPTPLPPSAIVLIDPTLIDLYIELAGVESGQAVKISMSEAALDSEIRSYAGTHPDQAYRYHSMQLENGTMTILGQITFEGLRADMSVTARPYVSRCWFDVDVADVRLGRFGAPAFVADEVAGFVHQWTDSYRETTPVCIQEIEIDGNRIVFVGVIE